MLPKARAAVPAPEPQAAETVKPPDRVPGAPTWLVTTTS